MSDPDRGGARQGGSGFDINCGVRVVRTNLMEKRRGGREGDDWRRRSSTTSRWGSGRQGIIPTSAQGPGGGAGDGDGLERCARGTRGRRTRSTARSTGGCSPRTRTKSARARRSAGSRRWGRWARGITTRRFRSWMRSTMRDAAEKMGVDRRRAGHGDDPQRQHEGLGHQVATDALTDDGARDGAGRDRRRTIASWRARASTRRRGKDYLSGMSCAANYAWVNRSSP